jgi:hypothetical protein
VIAEIRLPVAEEAADVRGALAFVVFLVPFHQEMDVSCVVARRTAHILLLLLVIFAVLLHVFIVEALERRAPSSGLHHEVVDHHLFTVCLLLMTLALCLSLLVFVLLAWLQRDALLLGGCGFLVGISCLLTAKLLILLALIMLGRLLAKEVQLELVVVEERSHLLVGAVD